MPRQEDEKDYFSLQRQENEEGFPDRSPWGLEGWNMAVKDNKGGGSVFTLFNNAWGMMSETRWGGLIHKPMCALTVCMNVWCTHLRFVDNKPVHVLSCYNIKPSY